ncbi:MAG: helix-turn-helix domain-containing protein [Planctomycetes bacterium]|nr:helix-turn-helix domain-containing protein [Planctomycetota bacterium]
MTKTKTTSAVQILERITGRDQQVRQAIEDHKLNSRVTEMILEARERAGLTQAQLAKLVGTTQSAISRLEDATFCSMVKASKVAPSRRRGGATRRTATA